MATGYSEHDAGGSGPPTPYRTEWDDKFSRIFDHMCRFLNQGYAITDLQGLERLAQLLYQIDEYRTLRETSLCKMSLVFTKMKLAETVEVLKKFRPLMRETSDAHFEVSQRLNLKKCFGDFFSYLDTIASKLITIVQENDARRDFLIYLQRIKFDVANLKTCVEEKFNGHPLVEVDMDQFHWATITNYSQNLYLPYGVFIILRELRKYGPLPPWLFPQNAPIIHKACFTTKIELQSQAPGGVCGLCNIKVVFLINMSVLEVCAHVFCYNCLRDWLATYCTDQWKCPRCSEPVDCYGSILGSDNDRTITFVVPPHRLIVTLEYSRRLVF